MKKIKVMVLVFMLAAIFSGCNNSTPDNDMLKEETSQTIGIDFRYGGEKISEDEMRAIQNECEKMLPLYKDIYEKAEKYPSSDWSDETVISQDGWHLPRKAYKRNTVIICSGNTRNEIGGSRSACHKADTHLSCGTGISVCRMD